MEMGQNRFSTVPRVSLSPQQKRLHPAVGLHCREAHGTILLLFSPVFRTYSTKIPLSKLGYSGRQPLASTHISLSIIHDSPQKCNRKAKKIIQGNHEFNRILFCKSVAFAQKTGVFSFQTAVCTPKSVSKFPHLRVLQKNHPFLPVLRAIDAVYPRKVFEKPTNCIHSVHIFAL